MRTLPEQDRAYLLLAATVYASTVAVDAPGPSLWNPEQANDIMAAFTDAFTVHVWRMWQARTARIAAFAPQT